MRLGVLWFVVLVAALAAGTIPVAVVYAAAAGWAGHQTALAWRARGTGAEPWSAAAVGAALPVAASFGVGLLGLAVLGCVGLALAAGVAATRGGHPLFVAAGSTVQSAVFVGLAAASVVLTVRLEIGAAVVLVVLVSAYEVGDYIVGSGAGTSVEGPMAGLVAVAVASLVVAVLAVPPFDGVDAFLFAGFVAVGCPLGQLVASALLPASDAHAPALRRLDSLLVLGPAWALLVGLYLDRLAS